VEQLTSFTIEDNYKRTTTMTWLHSTQTLARFSIF